MSTQHAPTLGEWMKKANPAARNIAVSGKDRGALMMGGHDIDQVYWWKGKQFVTLAGREPGPTAIAQNAEIDHIEALEAALAAIDPQAADRPTLARKDRLYGELFAVRRRRIERMS